MFNMTREKFNEEHKKLISKYNIGFEWNCDLWSVADGIMYYGKETDDKDDEWNKYLFTITGIGYANSGELTGDFEGVVKILTDGLFEHYKF